MMSPPPLLLWLPPMVVLLQLLLLLCPRHQAFLAKLSDQPLKRAERQWGRQLWQLQGDHCQAPAAGLIWW